MKINSRILTGELKNQVYQTYALIDLILSCELPVNTIIRRNEITYILVKALRERDQKEFYAIYNKDDGLFVVKDFQFMKVDATKYQFVTR